MIESGMPTSHISKYAPCGASPTILHKGREEYARALGSCARRMGKENGGWFY